MVLKFRCGIWGVLTTRPRPDSFPGWGHFFDPPRRPVRSLPVHSGPEALTPSPIRCRLDDHESKHGTVHMRILIIVLVFILLVMVDQFRFRGYYTSMMSERVSYYVMRLLP